MRERPILFGGPMVRAILSGAKTVTRRVVKREHCPTSAMIRGTDDHWLTFSQATSALIEWVRPVMRVRSWARPSKANLRLSATWRDENTLWTQDEVAGLCPYGLPGDRLWVKETWLPHEFDDHADIATYRADYNDGPIPKAILDEREGRSRWHSGRFMPRCASRITLEVVSVRVERLHALDDADALREGVMATVGHEALGRERLPGWPRQLFSVLWDEINGKRAAWVSNPWVWRIEFKVSGVVRRG